MMDSIIEMLKNASTFVQAAGVSVGGLVGVFLTLGFFFVLITLADKVGEKKR